MLYLSSQGKKEKKKPMYFNVQYTEYIKIKKGANIRANVLHLPSKLICILQNLNKINDTALPSLYLTSDKVT